MKLKQKESLRKSIQWELDAANDAMRTLELLPIQLFCEAFPQGQWCSSWRRFEFTLPFDFKLIQQVKDFMTMQFPDYVMNFESQHVWDVQAEAGHFMEYRKEGVHFTVGFRTTKEGTTCVLNKIGEKSIPVFEVICAEGAAEMVTA